MIPAWLAALFGKLTTIAVDRLVTAGELAAAEMERLWALDIIDPPIGSKHPRAADSLTEINRIIVRNGWGSPGEYKGNGSPQWCGMTAGDAWAAAGLDPKWLRVWWASTDRLVAWAGYEPFSGHKNVPRPATPAMRRVLCKLEAGKEPRVTPRRGDVVIVGNGSRVAGNHVTVCVGYAGRTVDTISGNGGGVGPHGDRREGISRRAFSIDATAGYRPMWLVRPGVGDLVA